MLFFICIHFFLSIFTLIVYLQAPEKGGVTNFYDSAEKKEETAKVLPITGNAVIFNHDTWHEGKYIEKGKKYIIRADVMFTRIDYGNTLVKLPILPSRLSHK